MAHSDPEEIERLLQRRSESVKAASPVASPVARPTVCDSCGTMLDPVVDMHRFRHASCPPPPLPLEAVGLLAVLSRTKAIQ